MHYGHYHPVCASSLPKSRSTAEHVSLSVCLAQSAALPTSFRFWCTDKIVKVLGEGGFSFVYLAQDEDSGVSMSPFVNASRL